MLLHITDMISVIICVYNKCRSNHQQLSTSEWLIGCVSAIGAKGLWFDPRHDHTFLCDSKSLSRHIFYQNIYTSENETVYGKHSYRPLPLDLDVKLKYFDRRKLPSPEKSGEGNIRRKLYPAKVIGADTIVGSYYTF